MSLRRRVSAPQAGTIDIEEPVPAAGSYTPSAPYLPYLSHITDGCSVLDVDPSACIPLFLARKRSDNAVKRLASILNGDTNDNQCVFGLTGMVAGTPTSVVVPLVSDLSYIVEEYLAKHHEDAEDVQLLKAKQEGWYGIIDGNQFLCALMELRSSDPAKWMDVKWKVLVVRPGLELSNYRKLSIVQNERNKQIYHYEPTLFDTLHTLRTIYDDLFKQRQKVSSSGTILIHHRDVAHEYDGGDHSRNTTIRQAVSVATRLSMKAIEAIGEVAEMNCVDIILSNNALNKHSLKSTSSVLSQYDCRLFKKFVSTSTLRGAKNFMNAVRENDEEAQINTIYRARHWCEENHFRSVKPTELNALFLCSKRALYEEEKFLKFINQRSWPKNMETTQENLLRTTTHDIALKANEGNNTDILPVIWKCFKRLYPSRAKGLEEKETATSKGSEEEERTDEQEKESQPPPELNKPEEISEEEKTRLLEEEAKLREIERRVKLRTEAERYLKEIGVVTHSVSFQEYKMDIWKASTPRVDLVLSSVTSRTIDDSLATQLAQFCKAVLKTGSYVFLIVNESDFHKFCSSFSSTGFKCCQHAFSIVYDTSTMRLRKNRDFPQRSSELAFIAKTHGTHPARFEPDFVGDSMNQGDTKSPSAFATLLNVETCEKKLRRPNHNSPIFPDERSHDLFMRIIKMFTPPEGSVLDPFAGPLTTAIACLKTIRSCVSMDKPSDSLRYAKSRLRIFAIPKASMRDLGDYLDPVDVAADQADSEEQEQRKRKASEELTGVDSAKRANNEGEGGNSKQNDHNGNNETMYAIVDDRKECTANENNVNGNDGITMTNANKDARDEDDKLEVDDEEYITDYEDYQSVSNDQKDEASADAADEDDTNIDSPSSNDLEGARALLAFKK